MIETKRLILKPVTLLDYDLYENILSCPDMTKYLPKGSPYTEQEVFSHVVKRVEHWNLGFGSYIVYLKSDLNKKLCYVGIETSPNPKCSEIRYAFTADGQGKGYALEAAKAVLKKTFQLDFHTDIYGVAVKANMPSVKILEKLGMVENSSAIIYDEEDLITLSVAKFV
ncbi:MAG: GNAT family N-acetyltransferase [Psychromonas sp.]